MVIYLKKNDNRYNKFPLFISVPISWVMNKTRTPFKSLGTNIVPYLQSCMRIIKCFKNEMFGYFTSQSTPDHIRQSGKAWCHCSSSWYTFWIHNYHSFIKCACTYKNLSTYRCIMAWIHLVVKPTIKKSQDARNET